MILLDMVYRESIYLSIHIYNYMCLKIHPSIHFMYRYTIYLSIYLSIYLFFSIRYYYALVSDFREELVESSVNLLSVLFNYSPPPGSIDISPQDENLSPALQVQRETKMANLFLAYISRLHQSEVIMIINYIT